jgi:hypothetical protein
LLLPLLLLPLLLLLMMMMMMMMKHGTHFCSWFSYLRQASGQLPWQLHCHLCCWRSSC